MEAAEQASAFEILGVDPALEVDENLLRNRYYTLSKQTHPDRFVAADFATQRLAARWSATVNRAYQTLRDPVRRAHHLMDLYGVSAHTPSSSPPFALAETYFELQEALDEGADRQRLRDFEAQLQHKLLEVSPSWTQLQKQWESANDEDRKTVLHKLGAQLTELRFLHSMLDDIKNRSSQGTQEES